MTADPQACDNGNVVTITSEVNQASVSYAWLQNNSNLPGENQSTLETTGAGQFLVRVTSQDNCQAEAGLQLARLPATPADIEPNFVICPDPPANEIAIVTPGDFVFYQAFLIETGQEVFESGGGTFELDEEGTYRFVLENAFGCETIDTTVVVRDCVPRVVAPNAFSLNASLTENQTFKIFPSFVQDFEIYIYNRWGEIIFYSNNLEDMEAVGWDGTFKGQFVQLGTYAYVMKFRSATNPDRGVFEQHGAITVIR